MRLITDGALDRDGVDALADRLGVTARHLRRLARQRAIDRGGYQFRIAYRPPYDWKSLIGFLRARATPGVERVEADRYQRTISLDGKSGTITVSPAADGPALILDVDFSDSRPLLSIVERVRRMFDGWLHISRARSPLRAVAPLARLRRHAALAVGADKHWTGWRR